jgi:predicted ATPase
LGEERRNIRFVMTGGPGAGKTTTLDALAMRGFRYVPESARAIIKRRKEAGLSPRPALEQFGTEMLEADMAQYRETPVQHDPVFFDRGVCDALGFLFFRGAISEAEAAVLIREFRYNEVVFVLPPWEDIYTMDTERDQSFAEAITVCESVLQWYARWGYQLVEVPRGSVEARVDFILHTIRCKIERP